MPQYIEKILKRFQHHKLSTPENSPHWAQDQQIGVAVQHTKPIDTSPPLSNNQRKQIQRIIGTLLYYRCAVDPALTIALSSIAAEQAKGTEQTTNNVAKLLNYVATHPDATIQYKKSDTLLCVHSNTSYLSEPKAHSSAGGYFFLGNKDDTFINGPTLSPTGVIKVFVS